MTEQPLSAQSKRPVRWSNEQGSDEWHMEIEHDRFSEGEPYVVSVWMEGVSEGETWDALATATPQQAREMADALRLYADYAESAQAALDQKQPESEDR